jgi:hypothetical protein
LRTIFLAHAEADLAFARRLTEFLEFGCDVVCYSEEGLIRAGEDLIGKAAQGLACDVLVLLLSPASSPARWRREQWEPILFDEARRTGVEVMTVLLGDCVYPPLLGRRNFIDAKANDLAAMRLLKRWIWEKEHGSVHPLTPEFSTGLEDLYCRLADQAGVVETGGAAASRFAREARQEFEAVLWVHCRGRSLAQNAGELGSQLGLKLDGTAEQNCRAIQDLLSRRRCLLVLDSPGPDAVAALIPQGRTSTLMTLDPVSVVETPESLAYAQGLVSTGRYAEAYELLYRLLNSGVAPENCARELTWICLHWDRVEEANSLRFHYGPQPSEQLSLF